MLPNNNRRPTLVLAAIILAVAAPAVYFARPEPHDPFAPLFYTTFSITIIFFVSAAARVILNRPTKTFPDTVRQTVRLIPCFAAPFIALTYWYATPFGSDISRLISMLVMSWMVGTALVWHVMSSPPLSVIGQIREEANDHLADHNERLSRLVAQRRVSEIQHHQRRRKIACCRIATSVLIDRAGSLFAFSTPPPTDDR